MSKSFESKKVNDHQRLQAMRSLALDAALAEIIRLLGPFGVHPLLLKGAGTARQLYDHVYERPYSDIDLLIAPEQFATTVSALGEAGFEPEPSFGDPEDPAGHHHEVMNRLEPISIAVELHHSLYLLSAPAEQVWKLLSKDARSIEIAGEQVSVPSPPAAALIVVLHAVQHGVGAATPMADLAHALERVDPASWRTASELADALDARESFAAGLRLLPSGCELADQLGLPVDPALPRHFRLRAMTAPYTSFGVERLVTAENMTARLKLLLHEACPPPAFMRRWKPVARRGPLGLACAYLWRPFWLTSKLPGGIRAWRKADRATRGG